MLSDPLAGKRRLVTEAMIAFFGNGYIPEAGVIASAPECVLDDLIDYYG